MAGGMRIAGKVELGGLTAGPTTERSKPEYPENVIQVEQEEVVVAHRGADDRLATTLNSHKP
jgi:hypothetical protein